jgi:hypothetical protein
MDQGRSVITAYLTAVAGLLVFAASDQPAQAQSIFCPTAVPPQSGVALSAGTCTNGTTGAFSNAALASEALSDLAQSTTQQASVTVGAALSARRQIELDRCPEGFERVNGMCQRIAAAAPVTAAAPPPTSPTPPAPTPTPQPSVAPVPGAAPAAPSPRRAAAPRVTATRVAARRMAPLYKARPPLPEPAVRYAYWVQGFGDFERRTGTSSASINCCTLAAPGGIPIPLALTGESRATLGGVLGGVDATWRNAWLGNDGIILGALTGYVSSDVRLTTTSISSNPANVGNGSSILNAHLQGPSAGGYLTYFNGVFSGDLTFRADFLSLSESFTDVLAFTANIGVPAVQSAFSGVGSTRLINYTTNGNLNYRIPWTMVSWIEPTVGVQYTQSDYATSAAALGLSNGHLVKVQAGARYGFEYIWGPAKVTTTITGLAYEDVTVSGGFIQNVAFGNNALIINDQGLLRGQGILAFNLAYTNGISLFAEGDVRGGKDLFGAGGKGGIRVTW